MAINARTLHVFLACTGLLGHALMLLLGLTNLSSTEKFIPAYFFAGTAVAFYWWVLGGQLLTSNRPIADQEKRFTRGHQLIRWTNSIYYPISVFPEALVLIGTDERFLDLQLFGLLLLPAALACWLIGLRAIWRSSEPRQN